MKQSLCNLDIIWDFNIISIFQNRVYNILILNGKKGSCLLSMLACLSDYRKI